MDAFMVAGLLVFLGLMLFVLGMWQRARLPHGRIIYIDARQLKHAPNTLYDPGLGLAGRPDYIIKGRRSSIPVELKSSAAPSQPYEGHILQLAAYCYLVESTSGHRPSHGVIRYRDASFRVDYNRALRHSLVKILAKMRNIGKTAPRRSHQLHVRCQACGYRTHCDQALD
jgi:CRISPR-associated exonuclease Cas4